MSFCVQTIIEKNLLNGARLVAGERGAGNTIHWVNCMEILDTPESLQRGELLVTTGYRLDNESEYSDFMERAYRRAISGIAIQPGYYISKIPEYIIETGNRLGLPIIELPPKLTFSSILHTLIKNISAPQSDAWDRDYGRIIDRLGPEREFSERAVIAVLCLGESKFFAEAQNPIIDRFLDSFSGLADGVAVYAETSIVAFLGTLGSGVTIDFLHAELSSVLDGDEQLSCRQIFCGISGVKELETREVALSRAYGVVKNLSSEGAFKGVCAEEGLSLLRWCRALSQQKETSADVHRLISPLQRYDTRHKKVLMRTLRLYLASRGQITVTARILGIHRKTIKKRLARIAEICGLSPETHFGAASFTLALAEFDYFFS